jgi:hypothetical protein
MGTTATDIAAITTAASTAAAQLIAAGRGGTTPYVTPGSVDPATGMPYTTGMLNPATGMPYGAIDPMTGRPYGEIASDYTIPLVIGGLVVVGIGGYFLMRKRGVAKNKRGLGRNSTNGRDIRLTDSERGKIGTISHNRSFTRRDWEEYGLPLRLFTRMQRAGMLKRTTRGHYAPTVKGWNEIEGSDDSVKAELNAALKGR